MCCNQMFASCLFHHTCVLVFRSSSAFLWSSDLDNLEGMILTCRNGLMTWYCSAQPGGRVSSFSVIPMSLWQYLSCLISFVVIFVSELSEPLPFVVIWGLSLEADGRGLLVMNSKKCPKGARRSFAFPRLACSSPLLSCRAHNLSPLLFELWGGSSLAGPTNHSSALLFPLLSSHVLQVPHQIQL